MIEDSKNSDEEITIRDIAKRISLWWHKIWPKRILILTLSIFFGLSGVVYNKYIVNPEYTATYTLIFQEESSGLSSALRLASNFGLSLGSNSSSSSSAIQEFITSRKNISNALLNGNSENKLIFRYFKKKLDKDFLFKESFFSKFGIDRRFTDSILTTTCISLNKKGIDSFIDDKTGALKLTVKSTDEIFCHDLSKLLISNTEAEFKNWKMEKRKAAVFAFQEKVDSLEAAIDISLMRLAEFEDQNLLVVSKVDKMNQIKLTIQLESLKIAFGEYLKGLEMAKVDLFNIDSPFKYFDVPTYPLNTKRVSSIVLGARNSIISGFLIMVFIIIRFEINEIISSIKDTQKT
jgi:uncharacterized protein involved in exopolysaccharide biosynthesis